MQTNKKRPLPTLDARLSAAAAYVRRGGVCADIGCDHGRLSVYLAAHDICARVIACDISEKPLARAARLVALHGCESKVECRLGDGLSALVPGEAQDIVIAGVSGVTICNILAAAPAFWQARSRYIFVPASKHEVLRAWLCANGFSLEDETPVCAASRYYTVLCAAYTGEVAAPTPLFCAIGLANKGTSAARGYLTKVMRALEKQGEHALAEEVKACMK